MNKFLDTMDVIWVSKIFISKEHQPAIVQQHLRYSYHLKPFLKNKLEQGWTVEEIENFGKIYRRPLTAKTIRL